MCSIVLKNMLVVSRPCNDSLIVEEIEDPHRICSARRIISNKSLIDSKVNFYILLVNFYEQFFIFWFIKNNEHLYLRLINDYYYSNVQWGIMSCCLLNASCTILCSLLKARSLRATSDVSVTYAIGEHI